MSGHAAAVVSSEFQQVPFPSLSDAEEASVGISSIRQIVRARQRRSSFFKATLFADPAWDILLELYVAELEQRRIATTSACIASGVPVTTALRWLKILDDEGLIEREPDPLDRRRIYLRLSRAASEGMRGYFQSTRIAFRFASAHSELPHRC